VQWAVERGVPLDYVAHESGGEGEQSGNGADADRGVCPHSVLYRPGDAHPVVKPGPVIDGEAARAERADT